MTSRKAPSLNEIVAAYLKRQKCERTLELFEKPTLKHIGCSNASVLRDLEAFVNYLEKKEVENKVKKEYDLGFEINFGAYQPNPKVKFKDRVVSSTWFSNHDMIEK